MERGLAHCPPVDRASSTNDLREEEGGASLLVRLARDDGRWHDRRCGASCFRCLHVPILVRIDRAVWRRHGDLAPGAFLCRWRSWLVGLRRCVCCCGLGVRCVGLATSASAAAPSSPLFRCARIAFERLEVWLDDHLGSLGFAASGRRIARCARTLVARGTARLAPVSLIASALGAISVRACAATVGARPACSARWPAAIAARSITIAPRFATRRTTARWPSITVASLARLARQRPARATGWSLFPTAPVIAPGAASAIAPRSATALAPRSATAVAPRSARSVSPWPAGLSSRTVSPGTTLAVAVSAPALSVATASSFSRAAIARADRREEVHHIMKLAKALGLRRCLFALEHAHQPDVGEAFSHRLERL